MVCRGQTGQSGPVWVIWFPFDLIICVRLRSEASHVDGHCHGEIGTPLGIELWENEDLDSTHLS